MATTFTPTYVRPSAGHTARGGAILDVDVTVGMQYRTDPRGGIALVSGMERLINRIARALSTEEGTYALNPTMGSQAVPGLTTTQNAAIKVADCARREIQGYSASNALSPADQTGRVVVNAVQQTDDPRSVDVTVTLYNGNGLGVQQVLNVFA